MANKNLRADISLIDESGPLALAAMSGGGLATLVGVDGGFSRAVGAQLGFHQDMRSGDLADHCLESALIGSMLNGSGRVLQRYGFGSPFVDIRLPCGGGIDVLLEPRPNVDVLQAALDLLRKRLSFTLALPLSGQAPMEVMNRAAGPRPGYFLRHFDPSLRLVIAGSGSEPRRLAKAARGVGIETVLLLPAGSDDETDAYPLWLFQTPAVRLDAHSAVVCLFHNAEWEHAVLPWALDSKAAYIGALGSAATHARRTASLVERGYNQEEVNRIYAPVGLIERCRDPASLAISILAEVLTELRKFEPLEERPVDMAHFKAEL